MAIVLIVLAVGSVVAGYVGLGARFEHFLEPLIPACRILLERLRHDFFELPR